MKRFEDFEKLSAADLERIASDESIMAPPTLGHDIECTARTLQILYGQTGTASSTPKRRVRVFSYCAAAAAAIAVVLTLSFHEPKDTFDDPMLAYAQLEQTFGFISEKMNAGFDIAQTAEPAIKKTINALK